MNINESFPAYVQIKSMKCSLLYRDIYSGHSPPWGGGFLSKVKNREEFEGGLEKRKGKGGKEEKTKE